MLCKKGGGDMAEIMAPAGGMEQLVAAVRSGAHRIYFGVGNLNARRNAKGFESAKQVIDYCHIHGVKATAALNIVLTDSQLEEASTLIKEVASAGGDGIIVQDLAAARLVKEICPSLPLHASTQMTIHNVQGAIILEQMGFSRAVLSRELSLEEITAIRKATKMELEVFVHGALCMSVSGCCYLSSMLGGRSGNRGLCAQPCRLDFTRGNKPYALSLKDMSHLEYLPQLAELGIDSFKIEGRMKRPEYVASVVHEARSALEGKKPNTELLRSVFSRSGFTDGYINGNRTEEMFGYRNKEDTKDTAKILPTLAELYRKERQQVPVDMTFVAKAGEPCQLTLTSPEATITVEGEVPAKAVNRPLTAEFVKDCLFRCGGTPYLPNGFTCDLDNGLMISMASLKNLRKQGLEQLEPLRLAAYERTCKSYLIPDFVNASPRENELHIQANTFSQIENIKNASRYLLPAREIIKNKELAREYGERLFALLPALSFSDTRLEKVLTKLKETGIKGVQVQNIGMIAPAKEMGFLVSGGAGLNITNSLALAEYEKLGLCDTLLSFELAEKQYKTIKGTLKRGMIGYGHLPLMRMRACPLKQGKTCGTCSGTGILRDRKGMEFSVSCDHKEYTTLYNPIPLYLGDKLLPTQYCTLQFTTESPVECEAIARLFVKGEKPNFNRTCGLFERSLL